MPDEKFYESHLLDIDEALARLAEWHDQKEHQVVKVAYQLWKDTVAWEATAVNEAGSAVLDSAKHTGNAHQA